MSNNFNPQKVARFKSKFRKTSTTAQPAQPGQTSAPSMAPAQPAQPHTPTVAPAQPQAPAQTRTAQQPQAQPTQSAQPAQPATTSASDSKTTRILIGVSALVLVAALAVGGTYLFMRNNDGTVTSPEPVAEDQQDTQPDESGVGGDEEAPAVSDGYDDTDDSNLSGAEKLDQKVEDDSVVVDQNLIGKWVPQISSKKVGMKAEGKVWDADAIYEEHQELANEYGASQVLLLKSEDYASYRQPGYYVTVIDSSYDNPDDALQWCTFHSLDADHCYAKQINTTGGPDGTTRLQE